MSFQAYLDNIEKQTGKTPNDFIALAKEKGFTTDTKAGEIATWLKDEYSLGHGHAMAMVHVIKHGPPVIPEVDAYISNLPDWQQAVCNNVRNLIHKADQAIAEEIKFGNRPYFTLQGNICALLAAKDHVNVFIYDPIAPDPSSIINQGHGNSTARSIQIYKGDVVNESAFTDLIRAVADNNRKGGWRKLKQS